MQTRKDTTGSRRRLGEISAIILCAMILSALSVRVPTVSAASKPQIIISPSFAALNIGQTFTMTVNLTDFPNLFVFQVVFKYNGTVLNMTSLTYPSNFVFSGQTSITVEPPYDTQAKGDTVDHLNYTVAGASLIGAGSVSVSNGVLCEANFTVVGVGESTIGIATVNRPAYSNKDTFYTFFQDPDQIVEYTDFVTKGCTILSGVSNAAPIAAFTVIHSTADSKTNLVLSQNPPSGVANYAVSYEDMPTGFNASESYSPVGHISKYIWNFGDGNTTVVNATSPADSFITHVYHTIGMFTVNLTVVNNGSINSPPLESLPATYVILVDLELPYYDWTWFIYTVAALIVAAIAIAAGRSAVRRARRRELKRQKMLTTVPSGRPPTGFQTT